MRTLLEICLTICEWIQERNIQRAARKAARKSEKKSILTYLSQGAVGGMIGYFLMSVAYSTQIGSFSSVLLMISLPLMLAFGAIWGSVAAVYVWLLAKLMGRRPGFLARTAIVLGVTSVLGFALSYWISEWPKDQQPSLLVQVGFVCVLYLPIVLMTGSGLRPGHLIFLGAKPRSKRHNLGSWLAFPAGTVLRVASIFALFESVLFLASWIAASAPERFNLAARERLPEIALAVFYFVISTYFSIRTPSKFVLLPTAILLNLPLVFLIASQQPISNADSEGLVYLFEGFIGLWGGYTLGRCVAPAPSSHVFKSLPANTHVHQAMVAKDFLVQL